MEKHKVAHLVNLKMALILYGMGIEMIITDGKFLTIRKDEAHEHKDISRICEKLQA
ncbi:hypothetical protein [Clostridium polynesiense]|uniref:hypothetical protein n=1 Tax=Clostridium polynesiense TaxID=1325933 RepID=UPI000A786D45|nr:hypothetical protein [Clostridium polynesiense]